MTKLIKFMKTKPEPLPVITPAEHRRQEAIESCTPVTAFTILFFVGFAVASIGVIVWMLIKSLGRM